MTEKIHTLELTDEELEVLTGFFANGLKHNDVIQGIEAGSLGNYQDFLDELKETLSYSDYVKYKKNLDIASFLFNKLYGMLETDK